MVPVTAPTDCLTGAEQQAWRGFLRAYAVLVRELDAELEAAHRLPLTSYEVLARLQDAPSRRMRMCDLADAVLLSRSGLTRLVDRLARDGLLERCSCPQDARGAFAVLTDEGERRLQAARYTHITGVRRLFLDRFEPDELARLGDACERLAPDPLDPQLTDPTTRC